MATESVPNAYILEGGVNEWLVTFGHDDPGVQPTPTPRAMSCTMSSPPHEIEYTLKITLQIKCGASGGGCCLS